MRATLRYTHYFEEPGEVYPWDKQSLRNALDDINLRIPSLEEMARWYTDPRVKRDLKRAEDQDLPDEWFHVYQEGIRGVV